MRTYSETVIICGQLCLFDDKAPFPEGKLSIDTAIEYNLADHTMRCHECGAWFQNLGTHVGVHQMSALEYKRAHLLLNNEALVSLPIQYAMSRSARSRGAGRVFTEAERERAYAQNRARRGTHPCLEPRRNLKGNCQVQMPEKLLDLGRKLGRGWNTTDLIEASISPEMVKRVLNVPTVASARSLLGLLPPAAKVVPRRFSRAYLIERLRDFSVEQQRAPTPRDCGHGLLPSLGTYRHEFGNFFQAKESAGLNNVTDHPPHPTRADLIKCLTDFIARRGSIPTPADCKSGELPSWSAYAREFGSFPGARRAAGIHGTPPRGPAAQRARNGRGAIAA